MTNLQTLYTCIRHCAKADALDAKAAGKTCADGAPFWSASEGVCAALWNLGFDEMPAAGADSYRRNYLDTLQQLTEPEAHAAEAALAF